MPDADPPIVVSGGSVNLKFKSDKLKEKVKGHHHCPDKTLKSITISGDGLNESFTFPTGKGVTISIYWDDEEDGGGK